MKITVWSVVTGKASGHLVMNIPATHTVHKVLDAYCTYKSVSASGYVMRSRDNLVLDPKKTLKQANIQNGDTLTLDLLGDEEQMFSFGSWRIVTCLSLLIGTIGLVSAFWLFLKPHSVPQKFGVVVDAGSSHSEVFVFTWNGDKPLGTADVKLLHRCFVSGGISSFATHADDLGRYFRRCIAEAEAHVPNFDRPSTPLYVEATAGMRILRDFDPEGAVAVLATVQNFFVMNTTFQVDHQNTEIVSGEVEGTSGWIAVNYLMNNLKQANIATVAALDIGGASVQVASELTQPGSWRTTDLTLFNKTHNKAKERQISFASMMRAYKTDVTHEAVEVTGRIFKPVVDFLRNMRIYSQSFLCYGIEQAQHRYEYLLVNKNKTNIEEAESTPLLVTIDPCLAKGVTRELATTDINGPCTLTDDSKPVLFGISNVSHSKLKKIFKNYYKDTADENTEHRKTDTEKVTSREGENNKMPRLSLQGSSNATECEEKISQIFDRQLCKKTFTYGDCMDAQSVPTTSGTLVAFSGLFQHLMLLLNLEQNTTFNQYEKVVFDVCSLDAESLYAVYPGLDKEIVEDLCFDAMFVYNLLTIGLGIDNSTWANVHFADELNNMEVVWPQGFMINRTTSFPLETPEHPLILSAFILLVLLFLGFVVIGVIFIRHSIKIKRQSASYQRLGLPLQEEIQP